VDINLTAVGDVNIPANVGVTFGDDGEKIEGDGTNLTIASSGILNLNSTGALVASHQAITDNHVLTVDQVGAADNDYAKFTANGLEGRSYTEVKQDLDLEIGIDVAAQTHASQHAVGGADSVFPVDPNADKYLKYNNTSNALEWADAGVGDMLAATYDPTSVAGDAFDMDNMVEGDTNKLVSAAEKSEWSGKQNALTFGIANTNALKVDDASAADNEYAKFTANGLEGRTYAEVLSDIGAQAALGFTAENVANKSTSVSTDGSSDTKYPSVKAVKDYADGLVVGLLDYRGAYDASVNTYPITGGSGAAGAVVKGDLWIISVAGTLGSEAVQVGDSIIANVDTPAQTATNWNHINGNISYVPENVANKETSALDTSTTKYPCNNVVNTALGTKVTANAGITGATKTKITYDAKGLVTGGADATTADIADSTNKRYVTDAEKTIIGNTSGINTGDQDATDFDIKDLTDSTNLRTSWSGKQNALTFGIANTNALKVDDASAADNEYAKFTANGIEGRTYAEVKQDLDLEVGTDVAAQTHASQHAVSGADTVFPAAPGADKYLMWDNDTGVLVWADAAGGGAWMFAGNTKALAGTDTASAVTPDDLKYVLDRRIQQYYGVSWNESADTYVRTGSTAGQPCGVTLADAFLPVQARMRGCILNDDGTVNYYLCATDWTKKEDGTTASDLTGTDGQVMVEIPKFWYRYGYSGTTHTWEVSPVPLTGFKVHEMFMSDDTEKDYVYVGAYEASLYDVSASKYVGQCYQTSVSAVFATSDDSITIATRTGWATALAVGQKLVITGTSKNNATVTVKTIESATKITVNENLTDETAATTVIETQTNVTDTSGDKLSSVSGVCPITGGSANGNRAHFRIWAQNRGGGKAANDAASAQWSQMYADAHSGLQLLYLTEYASFYSQSVLGYGIAAVEDWVEYNDYNPIAKTGNGNAIGNASGNTATDAITTGAAAKDVYLKYRGIENLYGHIWKFVDGYKVNNNIPYLCNNFANFSDAESTANYTNPKDANGAAITMHNANGYQGTLELTGRAFMPASITGGAADKKITDYYYQGSGWRVVYSGGSASNAADDGAFCLNASYVLAFVSRKIGGRLVLRK